MLYRLSYGSPKGGEVTLAARAFVAITDGAQASRYLTMHAKKTREEAEAPRLSAQGRARREQRAERLARALRDNLRRRKQQQRARRATADAPTDSDGETD